MLENIGIITPAALVFIFVVFIFVWSRRYVKVGPNQVLIVAGRKHVYLETDGTKSKRGFRIVKGGGTFVWPVVEMAQVLSLELKTLDFTTPEVYTQPGVPVVVDAVAQVKVKGDDISIATAAERFLSMGNKEIMNIALQTLEGHLRAIIGQMTVEDIYRNRDAFAQKVQEVAYSDMANMGLQIDSFTLRDIRDNQGYLEALGRPRIAQIKRDAVIAQAEADRDATIKSAQARQAGEEAKFQAETRIADANRGFQIKKNEYDIDINKKRAEADLAYDLQKFQTEQLVKVQEVQVQVIEKQKQVEVQEQEILRKERELAATVEKPANAEKYRVQTLAEAQKFRLETEAKGDAEAKKARGFADADVVKATGIAQADAEKAKGLAEADVILAQGNSQAEAMSKKADSWGKYNEAAALQMIIDRLPELAAAISRPLEKVDKMVVINSGGSDGGGVSKITGDVAQVIAQLPPVVEALSGVDLAELMQKIPQLKGLKGKKTSQPSQTE